MTETCSVWPTQRTIVIGLLSSMSIVWAVGSGSVACPHHGPFSAGFVIADVTEARSAPHELQQFVYFTAVPTICVSRGQSAFSMAADNEKYQWVLPARDYPTNERY